MDRQLSQKERERKFAEHFLDLIGRSEMIPVLEESESPDFLIDSEGRLGLEVVEVFRSPDGTDFEPQVQEGGWDAVAAGCSAAWAERDLPHVEVWLDFHSAYHVGKKRVPTVVRNVVDLVRRQLPPKGQEVRVSSVSLQYGHFPRELRSLKVSRVADYHRSYWHVDGPGIWVETLGREKIQSELDKKNKRVSDYRQRVDQTWLLMVVHGWRSSSIMDVPPTIARDEYRFDFDRVFVLDTLGEEVHELVRRGTG